MPKRIVVPEGMLKAFDNYEDGRDDTCECSCLSCANLRHKRLEAALLWLSENPMVPTLEQWADCLKDSGMAAYGIVTERMGPGAVAEWQSRMFLAPEPEVPEDIADLVGHYSPDCVGTTIAVSYLKELLSEAYRRGQRSKA